MCYSGPIKFYLPNRALSQASRTEPFHKSVVKKTKQTFEMVCQNDGRFTPFLFFLFTHLGFCPAGVTRSMWLAFLTACAASRIGNRRSTLNHQPARAVRLPTCCESYRTTQPGLARYLTLTLSRGDVRRQIVCHRADRVSETRGTEWHQFVLVMDSHARAHACANR